MSAEWVEWKARTGYASWTLADFKLQVPRIVGERDDWKARAEKAEAKVLAVEAECDRLARNRGGWDPDIARLFRHVLRSTDEDGQT